MKVLVLGGGGREHAIVWRLSRSASVEAIYAAPGNPGMAQLATCLPADVTNPAAVLALARSLGIDITVVGPEAPLVAGVVDAFRAAGRPIVGPSAAAAQLEGSKIFAKKFMQRAGVPTAAFAEASSEQEALSALDRLGVPVAIKADGLAAGKGVVLAATRVEAEQAINPSTRNFALKAFSSLCTTTGPIWRARWPRTSVNSSDTRSSKPSSPEVSGSPKRQAMERPS